MKTSGSVSSPPISSKKRSEGHECCDEARRQVGASRYDVLCVCSRSVFSDAKQRKSPDRKIPTRFRGRAAAELGKDDPPQTVAAFTQSGSPGARLCAARWRYWRRSAMIAPASPTRPPRWLSAGPLVPDAEVSWNWFVRGCKPLPRRIENKTREARRRLVAKPAQAPCMRCFVGAAAEIAGPLPAG